ncbi:MAG: ParB/RepB/Spo0J family partition protein [Acidobacteriota bacterium]
MLIREISLDKIDFEDETFRISEDVFSETLLTSIQRIGQLNPVVLVEKNERYRVVCGFRRLKALQRLKATKVAGRLLEGKIQLAAGLFDFAVWDNLSHRQLDPLEAARVVYKLNVEFGLAEDVLIETYLPRLGLPAHAQTISAQIALHTSHPAIRKLFKEGRLTLATVEILAEMHPSTMEKFASVMNRIRLSASRQRKFFSLLEDMAAINDSNPDDVFNDARITEVLENDRLTPGERGEGVYEILYRYRYPKMSDAERLFEERINSLGLPGTIHISSDPYFETSDLQVAFTARNPVSFRKLATELYEASRKPVLDLLYNIDGQVP